ncbi:unnamed protein product [Prorocentrum cordatum]|uniref:Uncharacterized protein n=1 Tax=Prorocentrum cordatum TaxID=2364126 RepID=A0ABN9PCA5_9DINO|nr:unnamed protein product [Polarella glacialis]
MKPQNILERHLRRRRRRRKRRREEEEGGRKEEGNVKAALKDAREVGAESTRSPRRPRRALQKPARGPPPVDAARAHRRMEEQEACREPPRSSQALWWGQS